MNRKNAVSFLVVTLGAGVMLVAFGTGCSFQGSSGGVTVRSGRDNTEQTQTTGSTVTIVTTTDASPPAAPDS